MKLPSPEHPAVTSYRGGYNRRVYDIRRLVDQLQREGTSDAFWEEVWGELYHQGDVGEATFALIPFLVAHVRGTPSIDPQCVAFVVSVEIDRELLGNPPVPSELSDSYFEAVQELPGVVIHHVDQTWPEQLVMYAAASIAIAHGRRLLAQAYCDFSSDEARTFVRDVLLGDPKE